MVRFDGASGYAYDGHRGTDFAVPSNTPVLAADDGTVIYSEWSDSGGWGVVIDHAYDRTAYFHNNQVFVYPGQHVSRGQLIALSGSTGNSTGPHVHFEVRDLLTPWHSVDPYGWTGPGKDPWRWDLGNLWTSNPPVPFLLPLVTAAPDSKAVQARARVTSRSRKGLPTYPASIAATSPRNRSRSAPSVVRTRAARPYWSRSRPISRCSVPR